MKLYLDLNKSVSQMPSNGIDTPDEDRGKAANTGSYAKDYAGAAAGDGYNAGTVTKADTVLAEKDKERNENRGEDEALAMPFKAKDKDKKEDKPEESMDKNIGGFAVVPDTDVVKDFKKRNSDVAKSASRMLNAVANRSEYINNLYRPNITEVEFLKSLGYTEEDVTTGAARITGHNRSKFNRWLHNNLLTSIDKLSKSVNNL